MATAAHRGAHPKIRAKYKSAVDAGEAFCAEPICVLPHRWIEPGTPWDLAHDRDTGGYRGPAHARCNRAEGARYGNHRRAGRPPVVRRTREW